MPLRVPTRAQAVEHPVQNGANMTRGRVRGTLYVTAMLLVLLAASPAVIDWLRPPQGYVKATAGLMNPALAGRLQTLEDVQRRKTDFEVEYSAIGIVATPETWSTPTRPTSAPTRSHSCSSCVTP